MSNIEKETLRKKYIEIRKNIPNKNYKSNIIFNKLIDSKEYKNSKSIALYKSLDSEVNTVDLIKFSISLGKIVSLPRVVGKKLNFYRINSIKDEFVKSKFGVEEPKEDECNLVRKNEIDLVIVPGICFDKDKNRLGFGKGYYDSFLENINADIVAICFEDQILKDKTLPIEKSDIKVQKIITEENIY